MIIRIAIGVICFAAGYWLCILMTASAVDSRIEEIREDYRKALAEAIRKAGE